MRICQLLYEGGFITYMRTDSKTYSKEFIDLTKNYILHNYEAKYINENIDSLITGSSKIDEGKEKKSKKTNERAYIERCQWSCQ